MISLIRSVAPLWFAFQIGAIRPLGSFLVTYQAALHMAYVGALPIQSGLPIGIRDCSKELAGAAPRDHQWLREVVLFALLPTVFLYGLAMQSGGRIVRDVFSLRLSPEHAAFLPLFFLGCAIGQIGHVVSVPIRASLHNRYITVCLIVSELLMNNVGVLILSHLGLAQPWRLGVLTIGYASVFLAAMVLSLRMLRKTVTSI